MTPLDRALQWLRVREALPHIPEDSRLLDIGCADGHLLRAAGGRLREGVGIDPDAPAARAAGDGERRAPNVPTKFPILRGAFPDDFRLPGPFDVITMLAVFEHFSEADQPRVVEACRALLRPGGRVVITVPAPKVDRIVDVLRTLRLAHGMDIDAHHGFAPEEIPQRFGGFKVVRHDLFEFGLNHLYVLEKTA